MTSLTDLTQKRWGKACRKLGLRIDKHSGKGSHIRVYSPNDKMHPITIPYHTHKMISTCIYKALLEWGFSKDEIDKALR